MNPLTSPETSISPALTQGGELPSAELMTASEQIADKRRHRATAATGMPRFFCPMGGYYFAGG